MIDRDSDTGIFVEQSIDDDIIRFDVECTEVLTLENNINNVFRINYRDQFLNLIIGSNTGFNLNSINSNSGGSNTLLGHNVGSSLITGTYNTLIGQSSGTNLNGSSNTFVGSFSGSSVPNIGSQNTFIGWSSGTLNQSGSENTFLGNSSGFNNSVGEENVFIGSKSSFNSSSSEQSVTIGAQVSSNVSFGNFGSVVIGYAAGLNGRFLGRNVIIGNQAGTAFSTSNFIEGNVILGNEAGFSLNGSNNIFIGNEAGHSESGSDKLYIENTNSTAPLIYGEFNNDLIRINGTLHISETAKLTPLATPPTCTSAEEGLLYFDETSKTLNVCKGSMGWKEVLTN